MIHLNLDNKKLAQTYDEISNIQFNDGLILLNDMEIKDGNCVLDIGCGTGRLGIHIMSIIGESGNFIGVDPLFERINIANEKNTYKNASFQVGTAENLSFIPDNSIDIVYLNAVFHWIENKEKALNEIYRVLKENGKIGITTGEKDLYDYREIKHILKDLLKDKLSSIPSFDNFTFGNSINLNTSELIGHLVKSKFKIEDVHLRTNENIFSSGEEIINFAESSSFGNFLGFVPEEYRPKIQKELSLEIDKNRSNKKIQFTSYNIFAIAKKNLKISNFNIN